MHARPAHPHVDFRISARAWPAWALMALGGIALAMADLAFAAGYWFLHSGMSPMRIPQSIAAWVLGTQEARAGGMTTAVLGTLLYCTTIVALVALYGRIAARWPRVHAHVGSIGFAYGVACYALILRILVPGFSAATVPQALPMSWTIACVAAWGGIGFGCAWIARALRAR